MTDNAASLTTTRVLHIGKYFPPHCGGMETYLRDLMRVQKAAGLEVAAVAHSSDRSFSDLEREVTMAQSGSFNIILAARWFNLGLMPISPFFLRTLRRVISKFNPDVIHVHQPNPSALWLIFLYRELSACVITHWHSDAQHPNSSLLHRFLYRVYSFFERRLLQLSDAIIVTSDNYLNGSPALQDFRNKSVVLPLGLDRHRLPTPSEIRPIKRPSGSGQLIVFVGRLAEYKGLDVLVEALQLLPDLTCWILGDGPEMSNLKSKIFTFGVANKVWLAGEVSDDFKWSAIATADALVLPSTSKLEAFGIVLLEATYVGTAAVATNLEGSGVTWLINAIPNGHAAEPNSTASLAAAINRCLRSRVDREPRDLTPPILDLGSHVNLLSMHYAELMRRRR